MFYSIMFQKTVWYAFHTLLTLPFNLHNEFYQENMKKINNKPITNWLYNRPISDPFAKWVYGLYLANIDILVNRKIIGIKGNYC